ncbi:MAG: hypothetical protein M1814_004665 [Vezdaea aestivalis]|nr:MAG: hypothetical protein M1814_004665 [Vezdaea aestivalis]
MPPKPKRSPLPDLPIHLHPSQITLPSLHALTALYPSHLSAHSTSKKPQSPTLESLDETRYITLPTTVRSRRSASSWGHITRSELVDLMRWKVRHGTPRPTLVSLAESNQDEVVRKVSKEAFEVLLGDGSEEGLPRLKIGRKGEGEVRIRRILAGVEKLSVLRGVGPATATLILSVADPEATPFLSDELWKWCHWADGGGWDAKMKYNKLEVEGVAWGVEEVRTRVNGGKGDCTAETLEKAAWVLGKGGVVDEQKEESTKRKADDEAEVVKEKRGRKTKRTKTRS